MTVAAELNESLLWTRKARSPTSLNGWNGCLRCTGGYNLPLWPECQHILHLSNILLLLVPHLVKVKLLVATNLGRRIGRDERRRKIKGENLRPLSFRLGAINLPLLVKLKVPILLIKLRKWDTNLGPLEIFVRETTTLIYTLASERCRECGPSLKELQFLSHPYLMNNPHHQPFVVMLETNHQPVTTRLNERKGESSSLAGYAREITLLTFFLV